MEVGNRLLMFIAVVCILCIQLSFLVFLVTLY